MSGQRWSLSGQRWCLMTGHTKWWIYQGKLVVDEIMIQHVQGYILAMEDVLKDIESMNYDAETMCTEYVDGHSSALESLRSRVNESLLSAQRTLEVLKANNDL